MSVNTGAAALSGTRQIEDCRMRFQLLGLTAILLFCLTFAAQAQQENSLQGRRDAAASRGFSFLPPSPAPPAGPAGSFPPMGTSMGAPMGETLDKRFGGDLSTPIR